MNWTDKTEDGSTHGGTPRLRILNEVYRRNLADACNDTAAAYPDKDLCLHDLFEKQAARTPDAVALVYEQQRLTYRDLAYRSDQLAHHLRNLGAGPRWRWWWESWAF